LGERHSLFNHELSKAVLISGRIVWLCWPMRLYLALILVLPLAACQPEEEPPVAPMQEDGCGAAGLQDLIGQAVEDKSFDAPVRIIPPGSAVTMDHRPDRLNVETDDAGIITRIYCG
jgi:hypothetical protein